MKLLLFLILVLFFAMPVGALPLQGGVSEDIIHPVPDQYRPGQIFDPRSLDQARVDNWVVVPSWAAGKWTRDVEVIQYMDGSQTSRKMRSSTSWGSQIDRNNNVWHCYPLPSVGVGEGPGEKSYSIWTTQTYDPPRADMLRYSGEGLSITVDTASGRIKQVVQSRALKSLTPNPDGTITSNSMESAYDEYGKKTIAFRGMTVYYRTGAFSPRPELYESFVRFLKNNQLSNYIPYSTGAAQGAQ